METFTFKDSDRIWWEISIKDTGSVQVERLDDNDSNEHIIWEWNIISEKLPGPQKSWSGTFVGQHDVTPTVNEILDQWTSEIIGICSSAMETQFFKVQLKQIGIF